MKLDLNFNVDDFDLSHVAIAVAALLGLLYIALEFPKVNSVAMHTFPIFPCAV